MITYRYFKRSIDILLSLALILVTLPLQIITTLLLILILKENPFFLQARGLTLDRHRFTLLKFRTIRSSQSHNKFHIHSKDIFLLPGLAFDLNWFTKWLRRTGLDELPQIYNVLAGQMSIVGPRPLMIQDLQILEKESPQNYLLRESIKSKPGLTGMWQIFGDRSKGVENLIGLDLFYEAEKSFRLDLKIFFLTIPIVLFAKNSDAIFPRKDFINWLIPISLREIDFVYYPESLNSESNISITSAAYSILIPSNWWYKSRSYVKQLKSEKKNTEHSDVL